MRKSSLADVYHYDLYGSRQEKYDFLAQNKIVDLNWAHLVNREPNFFFINKNYDDIDSYNLGFKLDELLSKFGSGFETQKDKLTIKLDKGEIEEVFSDFQTLDEKDIFSKYSFLKDTRDWKMRFAKEDILNSSFEQIELINYRPFDYRYTIYTGKSKGFIAYPRSDIFNHSKLDNLFLLCCKRQTSFDFQHVFISNLISERCSVSLQTGEVSYAFPLYLYPDYDEETQTELLNSNEKDKLIRTPNLNPEIVADIAKAINSTFTDEKIEQADIFAPIDILDYIYSVLHSPSYRETYKEFLKIDFPTVPYPKDAEQFWQLVALGSQLRQIHLLESSQLNEKIKSLGVSYPKSGDNTVTRKMTKSSKGFEPSKDDTSIGKVWINDDQYFDNVPLIAWEFYIGGYQPAQKWLKDRNGRVLTHADIKHYMNIIAALTLTDELMQKIDEIDVIG